MEFRRQTRWIVIVLIAVLGLLVGRGMRQGSTPETCVPAPDPHGRKLTALGGSSSSDPALMETMSAGGATQLELMFDVVGKASTSAELERFAAALLDNKANRNSETLWALLLARWSEINPAAMMAFIDGQGGQMALADLKKQALFAWGAVDPDGAFAAAKNRKQEFRRAALSGMATSQPQRAAELALKMPNAQFAISAVARAPTVGADTLDFLLKRSIYDGSRQPVQYAIMARLAKEDPAAAIESAQRAGRIWMDQVAQAFAEVAKHDPEEAAHHLEGLPDSRQLAISSVEVAKQWALQDTDTALLWARGLQPAARDSALVEIANLVGGRDPMAGLALIEEVGWAEVGTFYNIYANHIQSHDHATSQKVATALIRQIAATDRDAALSYIDNHVPEDLAETIRAAINTDSP